jgi:hypothetical protein
MDANGNSCEEVIDGPQLSFRNKEVLGATEWCGCYYCITVFRTSEIREWTDNGETAICPYCGVDAVVPNATDAVELQKSFDKYLSSV